MRAFLRAAVPPLVVVGACLAAWQAAVVLTGVGEYLVPSPVRVVQAFLADRHRFLDAAARTAAGTAAGFTLSLVLGVLAGSVLSLWRFVERGVYPLTLLLQMVPLVAVAPMLSIWFGWGPPSVIAASFLVSVFPVIASTLAGLRSVDEGHRELFAVLGASRVATWFKLGLPSALPSIATGLRISAGLAVIGAIVGEMVGGFGGDRTPLGAIVTSAMKQNRTPEMFAAIALAALVGFATFGVVSLASHLMLRRWHASAR